MKYAIREVQPLRHTESMAFVDGVRNGKPWGDFRRVQVPVYPPSPRGKALRAVRVQRGLSLRDCARLLRLTVVQMSGLESGSHDFLTDDGWERALDLVAGPA